MESQYELRFNQDFSSLTVISSQGFRLFSINGDNSVNEVYSDDSSEKMRIVERFLNSSLVVLVSEKKPHDLEMVHFRKPANICKCTYPTEILCVRMSRQRLVVCLLQSIRIQDIRTMNHLHTIENIAPNEFGLCTLSLTSQLAFPICTTTGELRIFNAEKLKGSLSIKAHETALCALTFELNGYMLATASERGTVIRLWCAKTGQRLQEFRRGVKRCVRIASLLFSKSGQFLCASSNTETVHIFKIDTKILMANDEAKKASKKENAVKCTAEAKASSEEASSEKESSEKASSEKESSEKASSENASSENGSEKASVTSVPPAPTHTSHSWSVSSYFTRAVSSVLPVQLGDVLAQDRSFATAILSQRGLRHVCGVALVQKKDWRLLIASADGFLYIHDFDPECGGLCKLLEVHDLRCPLQDVTELNLSDFTFDLKDSLTDITNTNPLTDAIAESSVTCIGTKSMNNTPDVIVENAINLPDNTYASVVKGITTANPLTESAIFRRLQDAIETPGKLYDEKQFPPVVDCREF